MYDDILCVLFVLSKLDYKTFVLQFFVKHVCCNDILHNASKSSELVFVN